MRTETIVVDGCPILVTPTGCRFRGEMPSFWQDADRIHHHVFEVTGRIPVRGIMYLIGSKNPDFWVERYDGDDRLHITGDRSPYAIPEFHRESSGKSVQAGTPTYCTLMGIVRGCIGKCMELNPEWENESHAAGWDRRAAGAFDDRDRALKQADEHDARGRECLLMAQRARDAAPRP